MKLALYAVLALFLTTGFVQAQPVLDVYKRGTKKHYYFASGKPIRIKVEGIKEPVNASWGFVDKGHLSG